MDSAAIRNEIKSMNIADPVLDGINDFVKKIKEDIIAAGNKKLKDIENLYSTFKNSKSMRDGPGGYHLDTVEENLKELEKDKKPVNSTLM